MDLDGSGNINYTEFIACGSPIDSILSKQHLKEAFDNIDIKEDGYIDNKEF